MNNMEDVDMIRIPMNELIFGSDKFVYLAREDLLHYCGMVEIGYMCILAYITFHWMLHVIDLRENCVYVLDSLRSKVNEDIHGIINVRLMRFELNGQLLLADLCVYYWFAMDGRICCLICVIIYKCIYWRIWSSWTYSVEYSFLYGSVEKCACILVLDLMHCRCLLLFYMEVYAGILGIIVCIVGELGIIVCIE
ncbi:hypothetical protein IC582_021232 [Cucumis melo]